MISKIHTSNHRIIVSLCDEDILGKVFEENEFILDLGSGFYKGEKRSEKELLSYIKNSYIINAVGKKSTGFLLNNKIIKEENLSHIKGVPFVQLIFS